MHRAGLEFTNTERVRLGRPKIYYKVRGLTRSQSAWTVRDTVNRDILEFDLHKIMFDIMYFA